MIKGYIRHKLLNPRAWGRSVSCAIVWSMIAGATVGAWSAWWYGRPWIEFDDMVAYYVKGDPAIHVSGVYVINRQCNHARARVIWRIEAIATDGQIALYGPQPVNPDVTEGKHFYMEVLPLLKEINPDGWRVTILATCTAVSDRQTIASDPAIVDMISPDIPRGGEL